MNILIIINFIISTKMSKNRENLDVQNNWEKSISHLFSWDVLKFIDKTKFYVEKLIDIDLLQLKIHVFVNLICKS